jgi:predicted ATP-dependent serine protease
VRSPIRGAVFVGRDLGQPGTAVFAGIEGTRPLLVEIQALVAPTSLGTPRRAVVGWDPSRLSMVLAVLEAHCGVRLGGHDVYLNVAGGMRIHEPAGDLAAAAALVSSLANAPLPADAVFGEVSLSGRCGRWRRAPPGSRKRPNWVVAPLFLKLRQRNGRAGLLTSPVLRASSRTFAAVCPARQNW